MEEGFARYNIPSIPKAQILIPRVIPFYKRVGITQEEEPDVSIKCWKMLRVRPAAEG